MFNTSRDTKDPKFDEEIKYLNQLMLFKLSNINFFIYVIELKSKFVGSGIQLLL